MDNKIVIRQAQPQDVNAVASVLWEAARWLDDMGMVMWRDDELTSEKLSAEVAAGVFFLAECDGEAAGTIRFELEDKLFWPDIPQQDSAFIHRLAIRRRFAGGEISSALLLWTIARTHEIGRRYLRLDCEAFRPKVRAIFERMGFSFHSYRQVGPYYVARYEYDVGALAPQRKR